MITAKRATREARPRDRKRKRLLLRVGSRAFHLTPAEARTLTAAIRRQL